MPEMKIRVKRPFSLNRTIIRLTILMSIIYWIMGTVPGFDTGCEFSVLALSRDIIWMALLFYFFGRWLGKECISIALQESFASGMAVLLSVLVLKFVIGV